MLFKDNSQIYPEPSSEETVSPTNDSEAQIITLCDTPILYDSIGSKDWFAASKERKKPRGRPRGRGRPKGSRNLPKEIQVNRFF